MKIKKALVGDMCDGAWHLFELRRHLTQKFPEMNPETIIEEAIRSMAELVSSGDVALLYFNDWGSAGKELQKNAVPMEIIANPLNWQDPQSVSEPTYGAGLSKQGHKNAKQLLS